MASKYYKEYEDTYDEKNYLAEVETYKPTDEEIISGCKNILGGWNPRHYQVSLFQHMQKGLNEGVRGLRVSNEWHRRAGKTQTELKVIAPFMIQKPASYFHFFPSLAEGRRIVWDALDADGVPMIDAIPKELRVRKDNQSMQIKLWNNSVYQIFGVKGTDGTANHLRGINPFIALFDEYAEQDPDCWKYIVSKCLGESGGHAIFTFTPRGNNHATRQHDAWRERMLVGDRRYHAVTLTIEDTFRHDGTPVISQETVEEERMSGIEEETIRQEYYCERDSGSLGAYYSRHMDLMSEEGRICLVPYDPRYPVYTAWDLGGGSQKGDYCAIWSFQRPTINAIKLIDYKQDNGKSLQSYFTELRSRDYPVRRHFLPHDGNHTESNAKTKIQNANTIGEDIAIVPMGKVQDGIDNVRDLFRQLWIDVDHCQTGIECLRHYKKKKDARTGQFIGPEHDQYSHGADALRTLADAIMKHDLVPVGNNSFTTEEEDIMAEAHFEEMEI